MDGSDKDDLILRQIMRRLVEQSLQQLGETPTDIVMTIPPGWNLKQCQSLKESVEILGISVRFQHEPIALLIASMHLARINLDEPIIIARMSDANPILVCDWGAGTVDISIVSVTRDYSRHEFACIGELTDLGHGGTSIARDVVIRHNPELARNDIERLVYLLQAYWQGDRYPGVDFSGYETTARLRRKQAAKDVTNKIKALFEESGIMNVSGMLCILHGGPLESKELRFLLKEYLGEHLGLSQNQFLHVGNTFTAKISHKNLPWRRDVLVATGAALFASRGEVLPEFEYQIHLKDSFGQTSSSIRLARNNHLKGIQVIVRPGKVAYFSGCEARPGRLASHRVASPWIDGSNPRD